MGFVQDNGVILVQKSIVGSLGQQDPVRHQLDIRFGARAIGEADFIADVLAEWRANFLGQTSGDRARGEPAGLRVADQAVHATSHVEADLGELG